MPNGLTGINSDVYIGYEISNRFYYTGLINAVRVYNQVLTKDEIALSDNLLPMGVVMLRRKR